MAAMILKTAVLTGVFCSVFAVFVDWITDNFGLGQLLGISFVSGFLGSIFANLVLRPWRSQTDDRTGERT